jgi:hypothetical protein
VADAATRWISPHYLSLTTLEPPRPAGVYVLNPSSTTAKVTATFYDAAGRVHEKTVHRIDGGCIRSFHPAEEESTSDGGWLRIESDLPIVPWGVTPIEELYLSSVWAPMSFFREETLEIREIWSEPVP